MGYQQALRKKGKEVEMWEKEQIGHREHHSKGRAPIIAQRTRRNDATEQRWIKGKYVQLYV